MEVDISDNETSFRQQVIFYDFIHQLRVISIIYTDQEDHHIIRKAALSDARETDVQLRGEAQWLI